MALKVQLSRAAMVELLSGPFGQAAVEEGANAIAAGVNAVAHDGPVDVVVDTHQAALSAAASVTLDHPGGMAIEAKYAPLTRAAAGAGMSVRGGAG